MDSIENFEVIYALSKLRREVWRFWYYNRKLFVDFYAIESRETSRHRWVIDSCYERLKLSNRHYDIILAEDVPLTEEVKNDARNTMINFIQDMSIEKVYK